MSIHFISGKPGGGKSLFGLMKLVEQLRTTKRHIFTNLPVNLELLQCYFDEQLGEHIHVIDRVTLLTEDDVPEFFRHRPCGKIPDALQKSDDKTPPLPDYTNVLDDGVCYILDEIHIFFNSRAWKTTGAGALFYLSQHRKLGDLTFCITQSIANVDKQFRSVAQDFTYCINERITKFGRFRKGSGFVWYAYNSPASGANAVAFESGKYPLDIALANCYNTAGGVGVNPKGSADKGAKAKGLPLWVVWLTIPIGLAAIWFFVQVALPAAFGRSSVAADLSQSSAAAVLVAQSDSVVSSRPSFPYHDSDLIETLRVVGFLRAGEQARLLLSDGSILAQDDESWQNVGLKGAMVDGRLIPWVRTK